ncbi:MAG: glycosyltransferase [Burkholderiaceae bacterium]
MNGPRPHVLLATVGSAGDMHPFLRLARELAARGHRVTLLAPAVHEAMARSVRSAGVAWVGLGTAERYEQLLAHPDVWHPRRGFRVLWDGLLEGLALLADHIAALPGDEPAALLAHPLALPSAALARARRPGLRVAAAWLAPANLRSVHDPLTIGPLRIPGWMPLAWRRWLWQRVDAALVDPVATPGLNAERARHGLAPVAHLIEHLQAVADASLTLFPPWFAPTAPDWPRPLVEGVFPLFDPDVDAPASGSGAAPGSRGSEASPDPLAAFLDAGAPPVVFTFGSANRQAHRDFADALAATRRLGTRAVFLTPHRAQVPADLPPEALWLPYVPLGALLPRAAALVHHGGIGTTAEGLRAGVPQAVAPLAYDQFDNAVRVEALGAGRRLARRPGPRALAAAIDALLGDPALRAGAAAAGRHAAGDAAVPLGTLAERVLGLGPAPPSSAG